MSSEVRSLIVSVALVACVVALPVAQKETQKAAPAQKGSPKLEAFKKEAVADVDGHAQMAQRMVDQIFSYGELGFQEIETNRYLIDILTTNGFSVQQGVAGIPTAFVATWGSGKPVIALGSDIDCIPQASQKPGVAYHEPMIEGAPGHGEGHNSGQAVNIIAALAVKKIMEREHLPGTLRIWTGTAEELVGSKAYFIRAGLFKDVDVALFTHVGDDIGRVVGRSRRAPGWYRCSTRFVGETAHAAGAPWRGRSALDAVELMDIGWNFRREHLRLSQRSHYVIPDGGDQPNVVPRTASVWYYFRETDYAAHQVPLGNRRHDGEGGGDDGWRRARADAGARQRLAAALQQGRRRSHWANIQKVGLPEWSDADQTARQGAAEGAEESEGGGAPHEVEGGAAGTGDGQHAAAAPTTSATSPGTSRRSRCAIPRTFPDLPGHNWANAIAMATPIAHKGVVAGAKVQAMTMLDLLTQPELVEQAWDYFRNVQTKETKYEPLLRPQDKPAIWLNKAIMDKYRPEMKKFYYDPSRYTTYLEQLGIAYPTLRTLTQ